MSHYRSFCYTSITAKNAKNFFIFFLFFLNQSHVYFPPLSLSVCSLNLSHSFSLPLSLCLAGLIECLNKLINHWHWWKTDRSGEVMFIKLPPICFFLIPVVVSLLNMHIFPPSLRSLCHGQG